MQEEGLAIEGKHILLLLHKEVHDKKGITEPLQVYMNKAGLIITTLVNMPTPLFEEPLKFISHGHIFGITVLPMIQPICISSFPHP